VHEKKANDEEEGGNEEDEIEDSGEEKTVDKESVEADILEGDQGEDSGTVAAATAADAGGDSMDDTVKSMETASHAMNGGEV